MQTATNGSCVVNNTDKPILLHNCHPDMPEWTCVLANLGGLTSTAIWFLILLPQFWRSTRHKTMQGVSSAWAIANFTAALNNSFFVFKLTGMPLYAYISAVYMPVLELALLGLFFYFAPRTRFKLIVTAVCVVVWVVLVSIQLALSLQFSHWMLWLSISLWSVQAFPQVFLNSQRQTTYGLSKVMVAMGAVGKTTDYLGPYLLCMPLQYAVLAFFSSTVSQISSLQVLWYWNRVPASVAAESVDGGGAAPIGDDDDGRVVQLPMTPGCQAARWLGISALVTELGAFAGAFVWRTGSWWALAAPLCTFAVCVAAWCAYHLRKVAAPAAAKAAADQLEPPPGPKLLDSAEQTEVDMK
uniref:Solute carrier family 40 protein n=2 Tax=Macrostomum lignano TaxID=282301 RepID=A0A1I8I3E5_9PLAT